MRNLTSRVPGRLLLELTEEDIVTFASILDKAQWHIEFGAGREEFPAEIELIEFLQNRMEALSVHRNG